MPRYCEKRPVAQIVRPRRHKVANGQLRFEKCYPSSIVVSFRHISYRSTRSRLRLSLFPRRKALRLSRPLQDRVFQWEQLKAE